MRNLALVLSVFLFLSADAQYTISGWVLEAEHSKPVPGSSAFITNTSLATITDKDGYFQISNIPEGIYKLVFTHVGFETVTYDFSTGKIPGKLKVMVRPRSLMMEPVVVGGYIKETWEKWGRTFLDYFIGLSENAGKSDIENKEALIFRYYKKLNKLEVVANEPIRIVNKGLGYSIDYELEKFEINFNERSNFFAGYTLFKDLKGSKRQIKKWKEKRQAAYAGSMMHFFRSSYKDRLKEEGFEVRRVRKIRNTEKDRVRLVCGIPLDRKLLGVPDIKGDSSDYYKKILAQDDITLQYDRSVLTADSIVINEKSATYVFWPHYLQVVNKGKIEEQGYLDYNNERRRPFPARSLIHLSGEALMIDANGSWYPAEGIMSEWYWAWSEKVGDMLPVNYEP